MLTQLMVYVGGFFKIFFVNIVIIIIKEKVSLMHW